MTDNNDQLSCTMSMLLVARPFSHKKNVLPYCFSQKMRHECLQILTDPLGESFERRLAVTICPKGPSSDLLWAVAMSPGTTPQMSCTPSFMRDVPGAWQRTPTLIPIILEVKSQPKFDYLEPGTPPSPSSGGSGDGGGGCGGRGPLSPTRSCCVSWCLLVGEPALLISHQPCCSCATRSTKFQRVRYS